MKAMTRGEMLKQFTPLDEESQEDWKRRLAKLHADIVEGAQEYVDKQRIRNAEIARLSQITTFG